MDDHRLDSIARRLRAWGLNGLAAALLESAGPAAFLGAQALYFAGPALTPFAPADEVTALARWLEDPDAMQAFAHQLAEETP
jgi:hypothetical protein